ncbi:hypothetical protein PAHAL_5G519400 [Panicum hallii]|uniref:RING-type E3 ubiquitin transferase n=1 Tax=Panicum hallii TaxID=206008 RepID=A0A2S3HZ19_9POAL|nr:RING-H2 finger protein ATL39-like [Panicum hallii]PAN32889.1 hypothetical protein PAHAL_5G519400 [Panicum hallii]
MPAATGSSDVACEYDGVGVALELAALAAFVVLLRYAAVLYANHLLATLSVDVDDDDLPAGTRGDNEGGRCGASGLDDAAIARLPCFVSPGAAAAECAVCLGAVEEGETARGLPCCTHAFHARCVDAWLRLRPTCPVCRATCR